MMIYRFLLFLFLFCWNLKFISAQTTAPNLPNKFEDLISKTESVDWIYLKSNYNITIDSVFEKYNNFWGLNSNSSIILSAVDTDDIGGIHYTFKQYYWGFEVFPVQVKIHQYPGKEMVINGIFSKNLNLSSNNYISLGTALDSAKSFFQKSIKQITPAQIIITNKDLTTESSSMCFAYKFGVSIDSSFETYDVFVNANTGQFIKSLSTTYNSSAQGHTKYYGKQNIEVTGFNKMNYFGCYFKSFDYPSANGFYCFDTTKTIVHFGDFQYDNFRQSIPNDTSMSEFCKDSSSIIQYTIQSDWLFAKFLEMMKLKFNYTFDRNKLLGDQFYCNTDYPNPNLKLQIDSTHYFHVNVNQFIRNESFYGKRAGIFIGRKIFTNMSKDSLKDTYLSSADIVFHEAGHYLINETSDLIYEKESGALNEGFADIIGAIGERYIYNNYVPNKIPNWKIGEDFNGFDSTDIQGDYNNKKYVRDLEFPDSTLNPSIYKGQYWVETDCCTSGFGNDQCGIHKNLGVLTKWYTLLHKGGTFNGKTIIKIPDSTIEKMVFYMIQNLLSTAKFVDALIISKLFANNYLTSSDVTNINNAWEAVGVSLPNVFLTDLFIDSSYTPKLGRNCFYYNQNNTHYGNIIVRSGYSLYLYLDTLRMSSASSIIVEKDAKLIIDDCYITNLSQSCDIEPFWNGIKTKPFVPYENSEGKLAEVLISNSTISNAYKGIQSGYYSLEQPPMPSLGMNRAVYNNRGGGNIIIEGSKFINNTIDIDYYANSYQTGALIARNSKFLVDANYKGEFKKSFINIFSIRDSIANIYNGYDSRLPQTIRTNILIEQDSFSNSYTSIGILHQSHYYDRIYFKSFKDSIRAYYRNNIFQNLDAGIGTFDIGNMYCFSNTFNACIKAIGINSANSINIDTCTFNGNTKDLVFNGNSIQEDANVSNSIFNNTNYEAVYLSGMNNANIEENIINELSSADIFGSEGDKDNSIRIEAGNNETKIRKNLFSKTPCLTGASCTGDRKHTPSLFESNGLFPNFFYKNYIKKYWYRGIKVRDLNLGLKIKCNSFGDSLPFVANAIEINGDIPNQGIGCNAHTEPAGNLFNWQIDNSNLSRKTIIVSTSPGEVTSPFTYYTHQKYLNISDWVDASNNADLGIKGTIVRCSGGGYNLQTNTCDDKNISLGKINPNQGTEGKIPCDDTWCPTERAISWAILDSNKELIYDVHTGENVLQYYKSVYQEYIDYTNQYIYQTYPCEGKEKVIEILQGSPVLPMQIRLGELFTEMGLWENAKTIYDNLPLLTWEKNLFRSENIQTSITDDIAAHQQVFGILYDHYSLGGNIDSLTPEQILTLEQIRISSNTAAGAAEKWLGRYFHTWLTRPMADSVGSTGSTIMIDTFTPIIISLSPNPVSDQVQIQFDIPCTYTLGKLMIYPVFTPSNHVYEEVLGSDNNLGNINGGNENISHYDKLISMNSADVGVYIVVLFVDGTRRGSSILIKNY